MEFDFYKKYQTLSDDELLYICNNPSRYQPRAVDDARRVLQEREVDIVASAPEKPQPTVQSALVDKVTRFFEEPSQPSNTWDFDTEGTLQEHTRAPAYVVKWHWALFTACVLFAIWNLYYILKVLMYYFDAPEIFSGAWELLIFLASISLNIAIVVGLYKRKPWGWSILFCSVTIFLGQKIATWCILYMDPYPKGILDYLQGVNFLFTIYYIGVFVLLNKVFLRNFYKVTIKRRNNTFLVAGIIFILQQILIYSLTSNH